MLINNLKVVLFFKNQGIVTRLQYFLPPTIPMYLYVCLHPTIVFMVDVGNFTVSVISKKPHFVSFFYICYFFQEILFVKVDLMW